MSELIWLPSLPDWQDRIAAGESWTDLVELANARIGFAETLQLDRILQRRFPSPPEGLSSRPIKLAVLGSATVEHLLPGLRLGALRRGIWLSVYTTAYGQYLQELADPASGLHAFKPDIILFACDAAHFLGGTASAEETFTAAAERMKALWSDAEEQFGCAVFQQTFLPTAPILLGNNEHRLPSSLHDLTRHMNMRLRDLAESGRVHLLAIDEQAAMDGLAAWHDPVWWFRARQEINPHAAPMYGDLVARMIAALQGRSYKCLALDLDNTLWGGVIGEDGIEGIRLGEGDAEGEAYLALQRYARDLSRRGIILAVCSKNDEANARLPFEKHPDMILKLSDISCFVANWNDKATNLRVIAERLNIGIDSIVFADDDPFERNIVRHALPAVAVPELPDDPALRVRCLAAAGYFEALRLTDEDRARTQQYQSNLQREQLKAVATDLEGYLKSLGMELHWSAFDAAGLPRVVQLISKTNQFNLTVRRYAESDIEALMNDPRIFTAQFRLRDRFGDNGVIGVVIGRGEADNMVLDSWLMSCRVLGRGIEDAALNVLAAEAGRRGIRHLIGSYVPGAKNGIVKDHYAKLGFHPDGTHRWRLSLDDFTPRQIPISIRKVA